MSIEETVTLPDACAIYAPGVGYVVGTLGMTRKAAMSLVSDRRANGEAFVGEYVVAISVRIRIPLDCDPRTATVTGYLV